MMAKNQNRSQIRTAIEEIVAQRRIPSATYRLQFNSSFTFQDARALLGYLDDLGISDVYASPLFLPRLGSTHGYDVADPTRLNSDLGDESDFDALTGALRKRDMGLLLDIVPNHMGINDPRNSWWLDVLENGPSSDFSDFFDIQWNPLRQEMANKVLLPILGDQYGIVLERGELRLNYASGNFYLTYWETVLPVASRTYAPILRLALEGMPEEAVTEGENNAGVTPLPMTVAPLNTMPPTAPVSSDPARIELESILTALSYLPPRTESDPERLAERTREKAVIKRRIDALYTESESFRRALDQAVTTINGEVGKPQSFDLLDELVDAQAYRLAFWRVAGEEINYRRFFDINELAAIRVEDERVFAATHSLAFRLLAEGKATGLRIDHPDGLYDPVTYFRRLQEQYLMVKLYEQWQSMAGGESNGKNSNGNGAGQADEELKTRAIMVQEVNSWLDTQARQPENARWPLYVVVEKILSEHEPLPPEWAVYGTTGYAFLATANSLFVDSRNEKVFTRVYTRFTRNRTSLRDLTFATKMMIMRDSLAGEITTLAQDLELIGERNRHYRDFTFGGIRTALREVIAALSIYRTYINAHQNRARNGSQPEGVDAQANTQQNAPLNQVSKRDQDFVRAAVREAKRRHPLLDDTVFDYIEDTLLLRNFENFAEEDRGQLAHWVMRFQQMTGPVMAKGVEDTAYYRYNRLVSLNEVGDHPAQFGNTVERFHDVYMRRAKLWPHAMSATSTHDNKRSEDVRARINVLSEMPDRWQTALSKWSRHNANKKRELEWESGTIHAPDANDEYLFYQTILGAWPLVEDNTEDGPWGCLLVPGDSEAYATFRERIGNYMLKAVKEAKVYTSWLNPEQEYEDALRRFIERVLQPSTRNRFLNELAPVARQIAYFGHFNSLSQTLLKLTAPGLPDIYQGNELWDFSLVDPDNRRPVDYARRIALLKEVRGAERRKAQGRVRYAEELVQQWHDGRIKLFVTHRGLQLRRTRRDLFTEGSYVPLEVSGSRAQHLCAYLRQGADGSYALVAVPRLVATLVGQAERPPVGVEVWADTAIHLPGEAGGTLTNIFTGAAHPLDNNRLAVADLLQHFPVALAVKEG